MDYQSIGSLFEKVKKLLGASQEQKETTQTLITKYIGYSIPLNQFEIKNSILKINSSPVIRNEIFMRKNQILSDAKNLNLNITDIK